MSETSENIEVNKVQIDYIKHIMTLSTGSVLLLTTFLEKLFTNPRWKPLVIVALVGFMIAILSGVASYTSFFWETDDLKGGPKDKGVHFVMGVVGWLGMMCGFVIGILSLGIFAIRNFV